MLPRNHVILTDAKMLALIARVSAAMKEYILRSSISVRRSVNFVDLFTESDNAVIQKPVIVA